MNSKFKHVYLLGMIMLGGLSLSSCSDDGGDDGGSSLKNAGVLDPRTGLRLRKVDYYNYGYQEDGRLRSMYISGSLRRYIFSYDPDKMVDVYDGNYEEAENYEVSYNSSGYVTSASGSAHWEDDDSPAWGEESHDLSFSYDGRGHLTEISATSKFKEYTEKGKTKTKTITDTYILTWSNNLLQTAVHMEGQDPSGPIRYETFTYEYDNDAMKNNVNKYLQYASFVDRFFPGYWNALSYVGLLGNGPAFLPSSFSYEEKKEYYTSTGEKITTTGHSFDSKCSYGFNSEGAISYDYANDYRTNYSYDHVTASSSGTSPVKKSLKKIIVSTS